ncbi:histidinol-phosphatase HisJ family protein [Desulfosporosinus meridiei]|uniref:Histidinol-phosphatase n=1 Tax=Desulfosporosinus meridiei (strain ATCC BAA-275 / DSM 13257 / KCTC 12902 / NCIMB 13706 / S10) TaxID=768704 RepID=J7J240_DESMD|nr:histidinol-phosphatase HisJ family protein [Desulfosporosinus meridiei]AFQ45353.1 histidinol phosphate phosphatase HisJ family [Desulfosporosinus meridiei DSM 13257]
MKKADYHIHSDFSPDSTLTMDQACERAISLGLEELCFTDHFEIAEDIRIDYTKYRQAVFRARERYGKQLSLKIGLEVGFDKNSQHQIQEYLEDKDFDFVIGSLHRAEGLDLFNGEFFRGKELKVAFSDYFKVIHESIPSFDFSVLGHITLIKRFFLLLKVNPSDIDWSYYDEGIQAILQDLIARGKGIELNLRNPLLDLDFRVLRFYKELGGEIITLGTDSHHTTSMHAMEEGFQALREVGFRYYCVFDHLKPLFVSI